jgi:hypothetical protein
VKTVDQVTATHILGDQELKDFARQHIPQLLRYFEEGQRQPLPFYLPLAEFKRKKPLKFTLENLERTYHSSKGEENLEMPITSDPYWQAIVERPNGEAELFTQEGFTQMDQLIEELTTEFFRRWDLGKRPSGKTKKQKEK